MPQGLSWKSKIGFILAASGAAVGLGNIQRFPYVVANYGGGAFLAFYLLFVFVLGIPLVLAEFSLGRFFQTNPYRVFRDSLPKGKIWALVSSLPILIPFFIFVYYLVISGWTVSFTVLSFVGSVSSLEEITGNVGISFGSSFVLLGLLSFVVYKGINKGIETLSKVLMPLLFVLLIALAINSLCLEKGLEGLKFFLTPDWSKVDAKLLIFAAGQAFFSLCVGEGVLLTYGSYVSKKENLVSSALAMVFFDTFVAFLSGLIIFPALFAFGFDLNQDTTLIYKVMPHIFSQWAYGSWLSLAFFLTLCFAAVTTCIALMEVVVNFMCETFSWSRLRSVLTFFFICLIPSYFVSLSKGVSPFWSNLSFEYFGLKGLYDLMDFFCGSLGMLVCGFFVAMIAGWIKLPEVKQELALGSSINPLILKVWGLFVRYLAPLLILFLLLSNFFQ